MTQLYLGVGLIAVALLGGLLALIASSSGPTGVARSLMLIESRVGRAEVGTSELGALDRLAAPFLHRANSLALALSPAGTAQRLGRMLDRAGNPAPWTVERVTTMKGGTVVLGSLLGVIYGGLSLRGVLLAVVLATAGFFLPDLLLHNVALRRQEAVTRGLAEALDMLTVCVRAGQGFDGALMQVARNIEGPIAGEFSRVLAEIQIGKSRAEAFTAMGARLHLAEVKNFTTALVQADRLGLPIGAVLAEQTETMRLVRRQRAEEKAQKVTIKILFPLLLCIFPALFIVVIGPGAISIFETFSTM